MVAAITAPLPQAHRSYTLPLEPKKGAEKGQEISKGALSFLKFFSHVPAVAALTPV